MNCFVAGVSGLLLAVAGCSGSAATCPPGPPLGPRSVTAMDSVSWELATFRVEVCVDATCDTVDVMRGGPEVSLPTVVGSAQIAPGPSGSGSEITIVLSDTAPADGTRLHVGDAVHVVVTDPTNGVVVCDMTAHVIDAPGGACGPHALDGFVDNP